MPLTPWQSLIRELVWLQWQRLIADPDHPYHWVTQIEDSLEISSWGLPNAFATD